jgi:hypothetical protein
VPVTPQVPVVSGDYAECRIQFRLPEGAPVVSIFPATEKLQNVREYAVSRVGGAPVTLSTTFPRKIFTDSDMSKTLKDLSKTLLRKAVWLWGQPCLILLSFSLQI